MCAQFRRFVGGPLLSALPVLILALVSTVGHAGQQREELRRPPEVALDISLPEGLQPRIRFAGGGMTLIPRQSLKVVDATAAGDLTAVDVWAKAEADSITVRLSIIYNDISNQEWWKDKKERVVGSYIIHRGESARATELTAFGIEPFEMRVVDAKPVVFSRGEGPRIVNKTTALEVAQLEKQLDRCSISLKNTSSKNIVAYSISMGRTGVGSRSVAGGPPVAAGATTRDQYLQCSSDNLEDIVISSVIFDDGSFEGDSRFAQQFLVHADGITIQAPHVLRKIQQTLAVDDGELRAAFDKLEAELWQIPEAIDKQPALEYLTKRFPGLDPKTVSGLYEDLKGGLYDARNIALTDIGQTRRYVQDLEERGQFASAVESIKRTLERLSESLGKIIATKKQ